MKKLSKDERVVLEQWSARFFAMPVHDELEHQLQLGIKGVEHTAVFGDRGVGKSYSIDRFCNRIRNREADAMLDDPTHMPVEVIYYESSPANGPKTGLMDLYQRLFGGDSRVGARFQSPTSLRDHIAAEVRRRNVRLICIDEAQMINSDNLDILRQVPDAALRNEQHVVGMMLIGDENLRDSLVEIRQLGQRFSGQVKFPQISRRELSAHWIGFHPHLTPLKEDLDGTDWRALEGDFFRTVNGSMRRLQRILENANELCLKWNRQLDEFVLRVAVEKIAGEA